MTRFREGSHRSFGGGGERGIGNPCGRATAPAPGANGNHSRSHTDETGISKLSQQAGSEATPVREVYRCVSPHTRSRSKYPRFAANSRSAGVDRAPHLLCCRALDVWPIRLRARRKIHICRLKQPKISPVTPGNNLTVCFNIISSDSSGLRELVDMRYLRYSDQVSVRSQKEMNHASHLFRRFNSGDNQPTGAVGSPRPPRKDRTGASPVHELMPPDAPATVDCAASCQSGMRSPWITMASDLTYPSDFAIDCPAIPGHRNGIVSHLIFRLYNPV